MSESRLTNVQPSQIKMKADSLPVRWNEDSLEFDDHSRLKADLVVFATGFVCNMRLVISSLLGSSVAGELDDYWGLDEEGELRGAYKQSGRELHSTLASNICLAALGLLPSSAKSGSHANYFYCRSGVLVHWRGSRSDKIVFSFYCASDQGEAFGNSISRV